VLKPLIVSFSLFACIVGSPYETVASDAVLKEIRFEKVSDTEEKVFFMLNGFHPPEIFALKGEEPRVVCDFLNTRLGNVANRLLDTQGALIQSIRVGVHTSAKFKIRVVIDLAPNQNYDIQQRFFQEESIFLITVCPDNARGKQ
jgi:hypothetical protein